MSEFERPKGTGPCPPYYSRCKAFSVCHRFVLALILMPCLFICGCPAGYLLHLGEGQARIVMGSSPVKELLSSGDMSSLHKEKVELILEAKTFGEENLGLTRSDNYGRYYEVKAQAVAYNLMASPQLLLEPYRWCFPIVGCVPYKGYFDKERALREERKMFEKGFDTYVRPVAAYSTLGWFKDPIFSSMLKYDEATLVELILHEMVHGTIFLKDQGAFNEGVATFIGERGTEKFFRTGERADNEFLARLEKKWKEKRLFGEIMNRLASNLRVLYDSDEEDSAKLEKRRELFDESKQSIASSMGPAGRSRYAGVLRQEWNNAFLAGYLTYRQDYSLWESVYRGFDGDLKAMMAWLKGLEGEADDPIPRIQEWLRERGIRVEEN